MSKKETDFCRSYKRYKAFCIIGRFEVTLNLIPDKFSLYRCPLLLQLERDKHCTEWILVFHEPRGKCLIIENFTVVEMRSKKSFIDSYYCCSWL